MAVGMYFPSTGFSPALYDKAVKELEATGAGFDSMPGRSFHCAMEANGSIAIFDVWETIEQAEKFGAALLPIMTKLGIDPTIPQTYTVHNIHQI